MAPFNPAVNPTNDPSYTRDFNAVDVPNNIQRQGQRENTIMPEGVRTGDRSYEYIGSAEGAAASGKALERKGYGDIFAGIVSAADYGIKAADTLIKKQIEKDVYEQGKAEQDRYIAELRTKTGRAAEEYSSTGSLLDARAEATDADLPEELGDLPQTLEGLSAASPAAGGRFRTTDYDARILQMAKDMRAKYPGYKQYIDDQFQKVTGRDSANRMITQMVSQINENANTTKQEKNKVLSFLQSQVANGTPGAAKVYEMYDKNMITKYKAMELLTPWLQRGATIQRMEAERNANEGQITWDKNRAKDELDFKVSTAAAAYFENMKFNVGPGLPKENFDQVMTRFNNGEISGPQMQQFGNVMKTQLQAMQAHLLAEATKGGRNSLSNVIGGDATNQIIAARMKLASDAVDLITKGEFKAADAVARQIKAITDQTQYELYTTPGIGPKVTTFEVQRRIFGDTGMGKVVEHGLKQGLDEQMQTWVDTHVNAMVTQSRRASNGKDVSLREIYSNINAKVTPAARQAVVESVTKILTDPTISDNAKANVAAASLSARNNDGFVGRIKIAADTKDEKGNIIPGRYTTFRSLTDPRILAALHAIGGDTWKDAKDWILNTWGKDLFVQDIAQLNKLQHDPRLVIGWNSDKKEFYVQTIQQENPREKGPNIPVYGGPGELATYKNTVETTINRLNSSFKSVMNMAKYEGDKGMDTEAYIFNTLQSAGWQPNAETRGLPQELYNAIITSRVREEKAKQEQKQNAKDFSGQR